MSSNAVDRVVPAASVAPTLTQQTTTVNDSAVQPASQPQIPTRLLSIQSSVVYGYVGNKASNFPLQLLGFDVDPIHTCQFSNHTGHPTFSGYKTSGEDCKLITKGLKDNGFLQQYTHLLAGYMSNVPFLEEAVILIQQMKQQKPELIFACDPVLGDNNALYVPAAFVNIYRDSLLPLADIATPNQTEAELLSGIPIRDLASAYQNLVWFHSKGIRTVIITSMTFPTAANDTSDDIQVMGSTISNLNDPFPTQYAHMQFKRIPTYFSGTGDLTTALLLAWLVKTRELEHQSQPASASTSTPTASTVFSFPTLVRALELTMSTLQSVIHRTAAAKSEELLLIQSKREIETPQISQHATVVDATKLAQQAKQNKQ